MSTVDGIVAFGAELTFEAEHERASTASRGDPGIRTAPKLTLVVTEAHERTPAELIDLLDRILEDRIDRFESLDLDINHARSTSGLTDTISDYVVTHGWDGRVSTDSIDSYYEYDPDRLLVTPERYAKALPTGLETSADASVDAAIDPH